MFITMEHVRHTVAAYLTVFPAERDRLTTFRNSLADGVAVIDPGEFRGHLTCSAIVVDPDLRTLHLQRRELGTWLLPGGHLAAGDASLSDAARRAAHEGAGVDPVHLRAWTGWETIPLDIDVHRLPGQPARGEAAHLHFDLRWLFSVVKRPVVVTAETEVTGFAWAKPHQIAAAEVRTKVHQVMAQQRRRVRTYVLPG